MDIRSILIASVIGIIMGAGASYAFEKAQIDHLQTLTRTLTSQNNELNSKAAAYNTTIETEKGQIANLNTSLTALQEKYNAVLDNLTCQKSTIHLTVPDDFIQIQDAIDSIPLGKTGDIHIRAGTYIPGIKQGWTSLIRIKSNIIIYGDGINETIIKRSRSKGGNSDLDIIGTPPGVSCFNVTISDLTLDGNYGALPPNSGGSCIALSHDMNDSHRGIIFNRVAAINARAGFTGRNLIGSSYTDFGVLVDGCYSSNVFTNCDFINSIYVIIRGNEFRNTYGDRGKGSTGGDAIFAESTTVYLPKGSDGSCHYWNITGNHTLNTGDTAIDISSSAHSGTGLPPHTMMIVKGNHIVNGDVRISGAHDVWFENNIVDQGSGIKGEIDADAGESQPVGLHINGNVVRTKGDYGIRLSLARNVECTNNTITFIGYSQNQVGIRAGIRGTGVIAFNTIVNSTNEGIDFCDTLLDDDIESLIIRGNTILNMGGYGIYDNDFPQNNVIIIGNRIFSNNGKYAVYTGYKYNNWIIVNNSFSVSGKNGDNAVFAQNSINYGNVKS